jgi:ubiquinone/menaquinone biosynthesis C-methylase UbiE
MALKDRVFYPLAWKLGQKYHEEYPKYLYPFVSRRLSSGDVVFLNFGYEEDPLMALPLEAADEPNRYWIQLYHRTATQADLTDKRVLEVGCGHGGGASYLMRTLHPASYTGLDLNPDGIAFCKKRHNVPGLDFVQGDAENLPFPDQSFDLVVNIESSANYPSLPRFLAEVARVLSPGGHFLYAAVYASPRIAAWEAALAEAPLRMVSQREINTEVVRGIEKSPWLEVTDRHTPAFLRGVTCKIMSMALAGTRQDLQSGAQSYRMYCFEKA